MLAREQARQAARGRAHSDTSNYTHNRCADLASDVWEPLLREALDLMNKAGYWNVDKSVRLANLKKALG